MFKNETLIGSVKNPSIGATHLLSPNNLMIEIIVKVIPHITQPQLQKKISPKIIAYVAIPKFLTNISKPGLILCRYNFSSLFRTNADKGPIIIAPINW
ncbi:Uncharacterised protein, partial [Mycoplasma putrefaciens]